jgi:hypothetical protein
MTTQVLCTVPQGLLNLPLGPNGSLVSFLPPSSLDVPSNGILLNSLAFDNVGFPVSVDGTAWNTFVNSALGKVLTQNGTPPALIAMN